MLTLWTPNCDIYLCSKGIFTIQFDTQKEMDIVLNEWQWFLGNVGPFISPWLPKFDATTMAVYTMLVWVGLQNLHLPF